MSRKVLLVVVAHTEIHPPAQTDAKARRFREDAHGVLESYVYRGFARICHLIRLAACE